MNAAPRSEKRRSLAPLAWAGAGTFVLHVAFLLALWLWPRPPIKPREVLLEVKLAKDKPPKATPVPTPRPLKVVKPRVIPLLQAKPHVVVRPRVVVKPKPIKQTRIAKRDVPPPTPVAPPTPMPQPTPIPRPTVPPPTPAPPPTPVPRPTVSPRAPKVPQTVPPASRAPKNKTTAPPKSASTKSPKTSDPAKAPAAGPTALPPKSRPSGGSSGGRLASNYSEPNENPGRGEGRPSTPTKTNDNPGSNSRGKSDETAGAAPGINLPHTRAQGGRNKRSDTPAGSAPTKSDDGLETNMGPPMPTSSSGGRQRPDATSDYGNGDEKTGAPRTGGIAKADGAAGGNSKAGRGADEVAGEGVGGGPRGSGVRGNSRQGRIGSRMASDPYATGDGNGGSGKGKDTGGEGGNGTGPRGGTRIAKRGLGEGDSDGNGSGVGRGNGLGSGKGDGRGAGDDNGGGGKGRGSGGDDTAGGGSSDSTGTGVGRSRRSRGNHRKGDTEEQLGRGIWGGFRMIFYQDKSRYPDDIDTRTIQGNPIDWKVFSHKVAEKTVPNLDYDWGVRPPVDGMKSTFWSMKAKGRIFVPKDDTYTFSFDDLDDAGRLILDGNTIIEVWKVQKSTSSSKATFLKQGPHDIQIEYVQGPATEASIKLSWSSTSFKNEIVGVYKAPGKD